MKFTSLKSFLALSTLWLLMVLGAQSQTIDTSSWGDGWKVFHATAGFAGVVEVGDLGDTLTAVEVAETDGVFFVSVARSLSDAELQNAGGVNVEPVFCVQSQGGVSSFQVNAFSVGGEPHIIVGSGGLEFVPGMSIDICAYWPAACSSSSSTSSISTGQSIGTGTVISKP